MKDYKITLTPTSLLQCLLTTLFIGLKLTGYIDWSWWWVFAPFWIPLCFSLVLVCGVLVVMYFVD